jgi:cytochrome d ubiquinol oxidase subunit I
MVSAANGLFTLLGFMGLYALLGLLFTVLMYREISHGPAPASAVPEPVHTAGL